MGKHENGYKRVERDLYPTPAWVLETLAGLIDVRGKVIWEPACGTGCLSKALIAAGAKVFNTDIIDYGYAAFDKIFDFVSSDVGSEGRDYLGRNFVGIITNPPFGPRGRLAELFIAYGIQRMGDGFLALLLPADFDSARTRMSLFGGCKRFVGKLVLTQRVKWFEHPTKPRMQPKENSAWYLWGNVEFRHPKTASPVIRYAPEMIV
jgi:hypothetical protein